MIRKLVLMLALVVAISPSAFAQGQAPSPGAGTPAPTSGIAAIAACGNITASGSYRLVSNLTAAGDCLVLSANLITIDLNGFTIIGNQTGSAIVSSNAFFVRGITIRNGNITGFVNGIDFAFTTGNVLIERIRVTNNTGYGIGVNGESIIKDNIAEQNGLGFFIGSRSLVSRNIAAFNTDGFNISVGSSVIDNVAANNTRDGFQLQNGVTVVNNTAFANARFGFLRNGGNYLGNTASLNGTDLAGGVTNSEHSVP